MAGDLQHWCLQPWVTKDAQKLSSGQDLEAFKRKQRLRSPAPWICCRCRSGAAKVTKM